MNATLILSEKSVDAEGGIMQIVIWKVPQPVPPTSHEFRGVAQLLEDFVAEVTKWRT
ncbi:hypothetical protein I6I07_16115 [Achromobacter deleyi]|uniref:Uncharacterized protein n=1 Tax=Achromobacter deleyi TaxID=1353891 RepID=A0A7T4AY71_9BURK|nr:hypothetical protein [Achromobacter deleyi]QQB32235.1 hypothetical protein I6I07_16115 [Achromobacter deleyi]